MITSHKGLQACFNTSLRHADQYFNHCDAATGTPGLSLSFGPWRRLKKPSMTRLEKDVIQAPASDLQLLQ